MNTQTNAIQGENETSANQTTSKALIWTGRVISTLVVLFMLMDGVMKLVKPAPVMEATARLGFPESALTIIGVVLLVCTILYAIPRTAVFGAILLTGYLGGAVATQVRAGSSLFETLFPVIFGVLVWSGIFLRDSRLRAMIPLRR
ncbi:MAG: DoxX family protein [Limisphaerales bacterium]